MNHGGRARAWSCTLAHRPPVAVSEDSLRGLSKPIDIVGINHASRHPIIWIDTRVVNPSALYSQSSPCLPTEAPLQPFLEPAQLRTDGTQPVRVCLCHCVCVCVCVRVRARTRVCIFEEEEEWGGGGAGCWKVSGRTDWWWDGWHGAAGEAHDLARFPSTERESHAAARWRSSAHACVRRFAILEKGWSGRGVEKPPTKCAYKSEKRCQREVGFRFDKLWPASPIRL
jgi:hypothetical protein